MALVCLVAATAAAAQQPRPRFAVGLGLTAPTGDYHADQSGEGFKIGWQGVAVMDYRKPGSPLGFRANAGYGENGGNNQLNADLTAFVGQPTHVIIKMLGADADLTYNLRRARQGAAGYLLGGIGAYRATFSVRSGGVTADTSETKFAWNVGAGSLVRSPRRQCSLSCATAMCRKPLAFRSWRRSRSRPASGLGACSRAVLSCWHRGGGDRWPSG